MDKVDLMSIAVSLGHYDNYVDEIINAAQAKRNYYACIANVHMLIEAYRNEEFSAVVRGANVITPDGKPLTWALKLLYGIQQPRVAGMDLLPDLLKKAAQKNLSVYFYGGTEQTLQHTAKHIETQYSSLKIAGSYSPPFRSLTVQEQDDTIQRINESGAHLVFVVLGCPKQERWMNGVTTKVNAALVGVGGALPVVVGMQKRAPKWMQKIGMEWFFRLLQEPQRLFKRYAITNTLFIYLLAKEYFRLKLTKVAL